MFEREQPQDFLDKLKNIFFSLLFNNKTNIFFCGISREDPPFSTQNPVNFSSFTFFSSEIFRSLKIFRNYLLYVSVII